ncbi:MAG: DNA-binding domain-containing protein [Alphaproteobacteria bacterium]|nr:DNA-binding domain-containing protein [Alphaproteobacteria bacterium]
MPPDGQTGFAAALLHPDLDVPQNLVDPHGRIASRRFAVYRNNVIVSLIEAVKSSFPAVLALVGETFFAEMARRFVRQAPPQSPLLFDYGRDFAGFIEDFEPAKSLPFLADVARLDRAWLDAYHAADAAPFAPAALAGRHDAALSETRFVPCPATRLVASAFPVVAIWRAARDGCQPHFSSAPQAEWALVTRPDLNIDVVPLDAATGGFFRDLLAGAPLGVAAEQALAADPGFDFGHALGLVVSGGAFAGVSAPNRE